MLAESEGSTLDNPYVKLDPYGRAPLAAVVLFETEDPSQVGFTVKGKSEKVDISKTIEDYKTSHSNEN